MQSISEPELCLERGEGLMRDGKTKVEEEYEMSGLFHKQYLFWVFTPLCMPQPDSHPRLYL
jgi:hypothetical protein